MLEKNIGLFTTMLFNDSENGIADIYRKLLGDKLPADLGYLYEIDFLITAKNKVIPLEVKSSAVKNHESIGQFEEKYSRQIGDRYLLSQKDVGKVGTLKLKPIYMAPFLLKDL